jgi:formate dehydrogenase major subunit
VTPELNRRQFFQASAAGIAGGGLLTAYGFDTTVAAAEIRSIKIDRATEVRSVCPYCAVGCSMIAYVLGDGGLNARKTLVHVEGDPDSPVNGGSLCAKGASTLQLAVNKRRALHPLYRAPGASEWQQLSWDDALDKLARLMKDSRDKNFTPADKDGKTVNRQTGFAFLGGATITNEEGYFACKLMRSLGTIYMEQQARL